MNQGLEEEDGLEKGHYLPQVPALPKDGVNNVILYSYYLLHADSFFFSNRKWCSLSHW
jgi:hypothetical protein